MTLNPFAPTFRPQQRPKSYSLSRKQRFVEMDPSGHSDSPTKTANPPTSNPHPQPIEEQIQSLSAQLSQLPTYSEVPIQQTTPSLQKFPLALLKQAQYLHSVQLTIAKLHQDLESEKLERHFPVTSLPTSERSHLHTKHTYESEDWNLSEAIFYRPTECRYNNKPLSARDP